MKTFIYKLKQQHPNAEIQTIDGSVYLDGRRHNIKGPAVKAWSDNGVLDGIQYWEDGKLIKKSDLGIAGKNLPPDQI